MLTLAKVMLALNPWSGRLFPELLQSRVSRQTSEGFSTGKEEGQGDVSVCALYDVTKGQPAELCVWDAPHVQWGRKRRGRSDFSYFSVVN